MSTDIPSVAAIRLELQRLGHAATQRLARLSGVPFSTIWKIRDGTTKNPGIETVSQFVRHLDAAKQGATEDQAPAADSTSVAFWR